MSEQTLRQELASVLNRHCAENASNTPDFLLADYLVDCLHAYERASLTRERWYGKALSISGVLDLPENVGDCRLPVPQCTDVNSLHDDVPAPPPITQTTSGH
jgi:hypothetical protein